MSLTREQKTAYQKTFDAALKKAQRIPDNTAKELLTTLRDYRLRIVDQIASAEGWNAYWLPQIQTAVDDVIGELGITLNSRMGGMIDNAWAQGVALVDDSFAAMNVVAPSIGMDLATLTMSQELSGGLITKLSGDLGNDIMTQVRLGVMAEKPQMQVIKEIGRILTTPGVEQPAGVFGKVATRAEAIVRTETMRVLNGGHRARAESLADEFPEMRKYWLATYDSRGRPHHIQVDKDTNPAHGGMPIPIKKGFTVGKYKNIAGPHDPKLGPEESVFCRCTMKTTLFGKKELDELHPNAKPPALPTVKKKV